MKQAGKPASEEGGVLGWSLCSGSRTGGISGLRRSGHFIIGGRTLEIISKEAPHLKIRKLRSRVVKGLTQSDSVGCVQLELLPTQHR